MAHARMTYSLPVRRWERFGQAFRKRAEFSVLNSGAGFSLRRPSGRLSRPARNRKRRPEGRRRLKPAPLFGHYGHLLLRATDLAPPVLRAGTFGGVFLGSQPKDLMVLRLIPPE